MNFCGLYDQQLAKRHRPLLITPLWGGWEFRPQQTSDANEWESLATALDWDLSPAILTDLRSNLWAVIITNSQQQIQYVNSRFEQMTGYLRQEVLGKRPDFLQGEGTSKLSRHRLGESVARQHSVSARLLNYRKDNTPYGCQVTIWPIANRQREIVSYIAFEQEVALHELDA